MFEFALLAACMPAHDDWLNDLSSTPPTSSTMHALRLPVDVVPELVEFLTMTYAAVPTGTESDHVDVDAELAELLLIDPEG